MRATFLVLSVLLALVVASHGLPSPPLGVETDFGKLMDKYATAEWKDEFMSLVQTGDGDGDAGGDAPAGGADGAPAAGADGAKPAESGAVGSCEVCVFVVENKEQHQPYLCRGLKDPNYQKGCVQVMESLMWWMTNQVYWLNYGCQRSMNGAVEWVRPCPAHAVCSWVENLYTRTPFCPADPYYPKPQ